MVADRNKLWAERKEGLKKTIEIVEEAERNEKFQTDQKDRIKEILSKVIELALKVGIPYTKAAPTDDEEEEIKLTKDKVENLLKLFKQQRAGIEAVKKILTIEIKVKADIDDKATKIKTAADKAAAQKLLDQIKNDAKLEERLIKTKEYNELRKLLKEYDAIKESYEALTKLSAGLLAAAKGDTRSDHFFRVGMDISVILQQMEKHIKEDGQLRALVQALENLVGDNGVEKSFFTLIDRKKQEIEKHVGPDFAVFIARTGSDIEDLIKKMKELLAVVVVALKELETDVSEILNWLLQIEILLADAKKLVK